MIPKESDNSAKPAKARFDTTRWSMIRRAGAAQGEEGRQALGKLIETYWYPLYAFVRCRGQTHDNAMDLTQGYFAQLLAGDGLETVSQDKGRFRSFLLASFSNFISNQRRSASTLRRGGGTTTFSLATPDLHARYEMESANHQTPELLYQKIWVHTLLQTVRSRLADEYTVAGKSELFLLLEPHITRGEDAVARAEITKRLKLSPAAVAMSLYRLRRRYGELLREEVAATVDDPADVESELRDLMTILSSR